MKLFNIIIFLIFISCSIKADQFDPRLTNLFQQLQSSENDTHINKITNEIWDIWNETNDYNIQPDFNRGIESMRRNDLSRSISFFTRVIEKKPEFAEAWNKRATVYFMIGDFDKSMLDIKETLKLEPRHFGAMDGMGLIFMHLKQYNEAIKIYNKMLEIFPNSQNTKNKKKLMKEYLSNPA